VKTARWIAAGFALGAACLGAERALRARDDSEPVVERLVAPAALGGRAPAAFTLETGGREILYLRAKGLWRCREALGAVCATDEVEAFLAAVIDARGTAAGAGALALARAGLADPDGLRLVLHGARVLSDPERDVIARLAFGPQRAGATFATFGDAPRVLAVDRDPRPLLDEAGRPAPLVDTRLLAGCLPPGFAGFEHMRIQTAAGAIEFVSAPPVEEGRERTWRIVHGAARARPPRGSRLPAA
jgi:hypothetical protein